MADVQLPELTTFDNATIGDLLLLWRHSGLPLIGVKAFFEGGRGEGASLVSIAEFGDEARPHPYVVDLFNLPPVPGIRLNTTHRVVPRHHPLNWNYRGIGNEGPGALYCSPGAAFLRVAGGEDPRAQPLYVDLVSGRLLPSRPVSHVVASSWDILHGQEEVVFSFPPTPAQR